MKIDVSFYLLVYPSPRGEERGFAVCNFRCSLMDSCARAELNRLQTDTDSTSFGRGGFLSEYKMCLSTTNLAKSLNPIAMLAGSKQSATSEKISEESNK